MPRVYLCGPMSGLTLEQARAWRQRAGDYLEQFNIEVLDPCRQVMDDKFIMDNFGVAGNPMLSGKALVTKDRMDVRRSDLILANLKGATKPGIGSVMEIAWADAYGIPVALVMEAHSNPNDHAFVRELCGFQFTELDEALIAIVLQLTGAEPDFTPSNREVKW